MSSPFKNKDHSNSDSNSKEEQKKQNIKETDEFSNHQKFALVADSSAGEADENLDVHMDEPKDKLVPKLRVKIREEDEDKVLRRIRTKSENEQLIDWIQNHKIRNVKASLKDRSLRHSIDDSGRTLLHISAECGNTVVTKYAMDIADVNARDSSGRTALMLAVEHNHAKVVEMLLPLSDIDVLDSEGKDVLQLGFAKKDLSTAIVILLLSELRRWYVNSEVIAEKLVDSGCQLYDAVFTKDVALMKSILSRGVDVNAADLETKRTALHTAVAIEEPEIVKALLEAGADAETLESHGMSPLYVNYACLRAPGDRNKLAILDLLLSRKVALTSTVGNGMFQVSTTLMFGCAEAIARLLRAGYLDFGAVDAKGGSLPIHHLAANCNRGVARQLKLYEGQYDYHVNATDEHGMVALHKAIVQGSVEMLQFLLEHGADANYAVVETNTPQKFTPVHLCADGRVPFVHGYLMATLLQHKADPQETVTDASGNSYTLFNCELKSRLKPAIAHLAMIEKQGELIIDLIKEKINSSAKFQGYFNRCQVVLDMKLFESITIFNLLSDSEKRVMGYLSNGELRLKLKRLSQKLGIHDSFLYYFITLRKRVMKLLWLKELRAKAAGIVCKWFENPLDEKHIVIERVLDFLDVSSLEQLTYL